MESTGIMMKFVPFTAGLVSPDHFITKPLPSSHFFSNMADDNMAVPSTSGDYSGPGPINYLPGK